jgi:hypothetical protein
MNNQDWTPEEDEAFNAVEKQSNLGKQILRDIEGQPYHFDKREWVGLTKEERDGKRVLDNGLLFNSAEAQVWEMAVEWAEAKLKEKNS